jgi:hypothetical protein
LAKAYEVFQQAYQQVSGLARTVRGPSMSAHPGKVVIDGIVQLAGEKVFALQFLQARNPNWVRRPFYARFDPHATWFDQLRPPFGESRFFFEQEAHADTGSIIFPPAREHSTVAIAANSDADKRASVS